MSPLSEDQIDKLIASIRGAEKGEQTLSLAAHYHAKFHEAQDKKVEELWDWKNRINGAVALVLRLQLILLGAFFAGAGIVAYFFLHH